MTLTQINKAGLDEIALDHVFTIGALGNSSAYTFQGEGLNGTVNNPTLYLTRGKTYRFENGSGGHPIRIQSTSGASGTAYNTGVTNNAGGGTVIVEVQHDAPDVLYYQCTSHAAMNGILYITGALADGGVTTAKLADDAVTSAKIATSGVESGNIQALAISTAKIQDNAITTTKIADSQITTAKINDDAVTNAKLASNCITNSEIAGNSIDGDKIANTSITGVKLVNGAINEARISNGSVTTDKIGDQAVTLAKLPHGTSSNDGKFLRANNGADPTFESLPSSGVTVSNNADNRVITGDGTNLNAESALVWTGTTLSVGNAGVTEYNPSAAASTMTVGDMSSGVNRGITIISHASQNGGLHFGDVDDDTAGAISYVHNGDYMRIFAGSSQRIRIDSDGLKFGSDTAAANALDDYEEGEATMTAYSNPYVNINATYNKMDYTKIGNVVTITGLIIISGVSSTNYFSINLPFTSVNHGNPRRSDSIGTVMHNNVSTGSVGLVCYLPMGSSVLYFYKVSNNSSWSILTNSDLASSDEMYFTITYKTA